MGFVRDADVKAGVVLSEVEHEDVSDVKEGWDDIILE